MEKKKLGINIRSRTLFENSYLDDEGRVAVGMNGGRGLTLRALRGHPRSRARIASDAAPGSVLLQIAGTPLLSYLQPLKLRRKREKKKEKGKENIKMAKIGKSFTERIPFFNDFSVRLFLLAGGLSLLALSTKPPLLSPTRRSLLSVGSGVGATAPPSSALLRDVKEALTCFEGL